MSAWISGSSARKPPPAGGGTRLCWPALSNGRGRKLASPFTAGPAASPPADSPLSARPAWRWLGFPGCRCRSLPGRSRPSDSRASKRSTKASTAFANDGRKPPARVGSSGSPDRLPATTSCISPGRTTLIRHHSRCRCRSFRTTSFTRTSSVWRITRSVPGSPHGTRTNAGWRLPPRSFHPSSSPANSGRHSPGTMDAWTWSTCRASIPCLPRASRRWPSRRCAVDSNSRPPSSSVRTTSCPTRILPVSSRQCGTYGRQATTRSLWCAALKRRVSEPPSRARFTRIAPSRRQRGIYAALGSCRMPTCSP